MWWIGALQIALAAAGVPDAVPFTVRVDIDIVAGVPSAVVSSADAGLVLPACRGVVWQRFDPVTETFVALTDEPCGADGPGLPIGSSGLRAPLDPLPASGTVVRAVATWGVGCQPGLPVPVAGCTELRSSVSPIWTVRVADR